LKRAFFTDDYFSFIGHISYSVYLIHPVVLHLLSVISPDGIRLVLVTFVITIGVSILTYKFIESPLIRFGNSLTIATDVEFSVSTPENF